MLNNQHSFIKRNEEKFITTVPYNIIQHIFELNAKPLILRWFWLSDRTTPTFSVTAGEDRGLYKSIINENYETEIPQYFNNIIKGDFAFWRRAYWNGKPLALVTVPMAHGERALSDVIIYNGRLHVKVPENFVAYLDLRARSSLTWSVADGFWVLEKSTKKVGAKSWGLTAQGTIALPDEFPAEDGDQVEWVVGDIEGEPVALLKKYGARTNTLLDEFLESALKPAKGSYVLKSQLYKAYIQFAVAHGTKPLSQNAFFTALEKRGIKKIRQVNTRGGKTQAIDGFLLVSQQFGGMEGGQHA